MSATVMADPEVLDSSVQGDYWPKPIITLDKAHDPPAEPDIIQSPQPQTAVPQPPKDRMTIERNNLLAAAKMLIKDLIDSSLKKGRMIDDNHIPFQQFLTVIEHILLHGLKPVKGLFKDTKDVWAVLMLVEKHCSDAVDITTSIKEMTNVKTPISRARAWLRLALMQKRLADYFKVLVDLRESVLLDMYTKGSFMLEDELFIFSGLLVGLNVIDCSFSVKDEDLENPLGIIDFSVFIKDSFLTQENEEVNTSQMDAILDQKNYLEELNRHLTATVNNLQQKVEALSTQNLLLKEDLSISRNNVIELQRENSEISHTKDQLLAHHSKQLEATKEDIEVERETYENSRQGLDKMCQDLQYRLKEEIVTRQEVEKELELQISLKQEKEMALQLLEKDVHEKQDALVSARRQLEEVKKRNLDLTKESLEKDTLLQHKTDMVKRLEDNNNQMKKSMTESDAKLKQCQNELKKQEEAARKSAEKLIDKDSKRTALETDLKIEKEWRATLQSNLEKEKEKTSKLQSDVQQFKELQREYARLQEQNDLLKRTCEEQEATLRDLGSHLSESKLKVEDLKETQQILKEAQWADDKDVTNCRQCKKTFSVSRRKHHCRNCGEIYCNECSENKMPLPSSAKPVRVCDACHTVLLQRYSAS